MPSYKFLQLDVFTNRPFEGNQLAVFYDARGLDADAMLKLTQEMNYAESTFILPAERPDTDIRMRIFTPGREMPMAGHPTIGSTYALAHLKTIAAGRDKWVWGLNVGPTPVELDWNGNGLNFAWMDQQPPEFRPSKAKAADVARAVGVDVAAIEATGLPLEEVSCGVPFLYVPVATRAAVDEAEVDVAALKRLPSAFGQPSAPVFLFSTEPVDPDVTAYSRMFAPGFGIIEDPATGAASGPLGSYLVKHRLVSGDRQKKIVSFQGVKMGRPSRIHIAIHGNADRITRVQVGGQAVLVGEGTITF